MINRVYKKCKNGHLYESDIYGNRCPFCNHPTILDYVLRQGIVTGELKLINYSLPVVDCFNVDAKNKYDNQVRNEMINCAVCGCSYHPAYSHCGKNVWNNGCPECENRTRIKHFLSDISGGIEIYEKYYENSHRHDYFGNNN